MGLQSEQEFNCAVVKQHDFQTDHPEHDRRHMKEWVDREGILARHLDVRFTNVLVAERLMGKKNRYAGVASFVRGDQIEIGLSANDASFSIDFMVCHLDGKNASDENARAKLIADFVVKTMRDYQHQHFW